MPAATLPAHASLAAQMPSSSSSPKESTTTTTEEIKYIPGQGFKKIAVPTDYRQPGLNWLHLGILLGIPLVALYGVLTTPLVPRTLLVAAVTYFCTGFGITGGYHRLWSHKAWDAPAPVRFVILLFGAAALQGSARWWCRNHRAHHKFTDTTKDPYNVRKGFFFAHFLWMMRKQDPKEVGYANIDDLNADPMIMWQHKYYSQIALFTSIALPTLICGLLWGDYRGGFFYASLCRIVFVHHATFFVNSLAHYLGDQAYSDLHTAFDSVITALLTLGEGYHNYHHEFPQDYRNGIFWFHYDPTKWTITLLYYLGLARNLRWVPKNEIEKAKLQMKMARLAEYRNKLDHGKKYDSNLKSYSWRSIQQEVEKGLAVVVIDGKVYDVSEWVDVHPGGRETLLRYSGEDVSAVFRGDTNEHIHSEYARVMLPRFLIGHLEDKEENMTK